MTEDDIKRLDDLREHATARARAARDAMMAAEKEAGEYAKEACLARFEVRGINPGDPVTLTVRRPGGHDALVNAFVRGVHGWRGIEWAAETATGKMALRKSPYIGFGTIVDFHKREV